MHGEIYGVSREGKCGTNNKDYKEEYRDMELLQLGKDVFLTWAWIDMKMGNVAQYWDTWMHFRGI